MDLQTDPSNCGTLGNQCGNLCANGVCADACPNGTQDCNSACVDTDTDPLNCGDCNQACDRDQVCSNGNCADFRAATGCNSCPCTGCGQGGQGQCCSYPGTTDPICVNGGGCP